MILDHERLSLLLELKKDPLAPYARLADRVQIAPPTVKSWIQQMKEDGILRKDGEIDDPVLGTRKISETIAYVNTEKIGLKRIYFLLEDIASYDAYKQICTCMDQHPYTTYTSLCMGNNINMHAEFQIPPNEVQLLKKFLREIRDKGLFQRFISIDPINICKSDDDLKKWDSYPFKDDPRTSTENKIKEKKLKKLFDEALKQSIEIEDQGPKKINDEIANLDPLNLQILRELTINGNLSIKYISSFYEKDRSTISRRIKYVRENYVDHYNILYNKAIFHLGTSFFIYGSIDRRASIAIRKLIQDNHIPFYSKFLEDKKNFFWKIYAPTIFANQLTRLIASHCTSISQLIVHTDTNARYFFYHKNYDAENRDWRGGEEYIVSDPIRNAKISKSPASSPDNPT